MKYWDTSAVVPLLLEQEASEAVRSIAEDDPGMATWWGTPVDAISAAARLRREELLTVDEEERVLELLSLLQDGWLEVLPSDEVRAQAQRLLRIHSLKAADALQLAAALVWSGRATGAGLVTFDERLGLAARLEGFEVLP